MGFEELKLGRRLDGQMADGIIDINCLLKVRKSRKQFMVSLILQKNEKKMKKNQPTSTMISQVDFFVHFFGELKTL